LNYKVPQSKLVHINHGVLLCPLYDKQEARKKLGIPQNKKVVMSMGFFGGLKGVDELIGIHAELIKTDPNILFYFVGGLHYATAIYGRDYMKQCFKNILNKGLKDKFIKTMGLSLLTDTEYGIGVCWQIHAHVEKFLNDAGVKAAALIADNVYAAYLRQADELRQPPPERWPDIEKAECRADGAHIVRDNIHDLITPG